MKKFFLLLISLLLASGALRAADEEQLAVLKVGSEVYSNVTITSVSATDVYFIYGQGMANAKLKDLDPALQQHFKFNARKAAAVEKKQAADNAQFHQNLLKPVAAQPPDEERTGAGSSAGKQLWANSYLNQPAPQIIVEKWLTPEPDCRGKWVMVDFWATWCPPCRAAISELNGYHHKFGDRLVVIGLSDETEAAVRRMTNPAIEYAVAIDTQGRTKKAMAVTGIPHVLLIDPQGIVRWEGFPFLEGHELTEDVVAKTMAAYSK